jgi:hypothetical protein
MMVRKRKHFTAAFAALSLALAWLVVVPAANAAFGIVPGSLGATLSTTQAGAHPDLTTTFMMNTRVEDGLLAVDDNVKDVKVDLPAGVSGAATATPRCAAREFFGSGCPASAQVGVATVYFNILGMPYSGTAPVFNVEPHHGRTAEFGFRMIIAQQSMIARVRADGGLQTVIPSVSEAIQVVGTSLTLWGVPALPVHDPQRGTNFTCSGDPSDPANCFGGETPSPVPLRPFLTNPTQCSGQPLEATFRLRSWQDPEAELQYQAPMGTITGCEKLHFDPKISVRPSTRRVDSPTGLSVRVEVPQNDDPNGFATANLRRAVVTLPEGLSLNPAAAEGLAACADGDLGLGNTDDPSCPDAAKVGTAELHTPALANPLSGPIYLRPQTAGDPYRIAFVLQGEGVTLKVPGSVHADPVTGRLTTTFDDAPQQPFSDLELTFNGGDRAPLATPTVCGVGATTGVFTPWSAPFSGPPAESSSSFEFAWDQQGSPCPASLPFSPGFEAGTTVPIAGGHSPFVFRVTRKDREQPLGRISGVALPGGVLAKVAGVPLCGAAQAAAGSCGDGSRIGSVTAGSGAGSPLYLDGKVFLTEGYKGAPYGLSIVVPAVAGPFDLGDVVVRAAVRVNPADASLTVDSDPLPTILQGIPLRLRDIVVHLDRRGFTLNPTSCAPKRIDATIGSVSGQTADVGSRFQVTNCAALGFKPRLGLALTGSRQTRTGKHPGVRAKLSQGSGQAAIKRAVVSLPKALALDPDNAKALCEFDAGTQPDLENHCPEGSIVGRVRAKSPLLNRDLVGDVYFVKNVRIDKKTGAKRRTLPMLVAALRGEIAINLKGASSVRGDGRLVAAFSGVPDAPIARFDLNLRGGANGILVVTDSARGRLNLCTRKQTAQVDTTGHNGRRANYPIRVKTPCAGRRRN